MMGDPPTPQGQFFYAFNLDEKVPQDHLLRQIDGVINLRGLYTCLPIGRIIPPLNLVPPPPSCNPILSWVGLA